MTIDVKQITAIANALDGLIVSLNRTYENVQFLQVELFKCIVKLVEDAHHKG